jgi:hypothetical protein
MLIHDGQVERLYKVVTSSRSVDNDQSLLELEILDTLSIWRTVKSMCFGRFGNH